MLKELRFRFRHDGCWLQETTEKHPDVMLVASAIYLADGVVHMNVTVHAPHAATVASLQLCTAAVPPEFCPALICVQVGAPEPSTTRTP